MRNFVRLLFDSDYYLRAALIKLGTEDEEIHWLQMPGRQSKETLPCTLATATDTELEESDISQVLGTFELLQGCNSWEVALT